LETIWKREKCSKSKAKKVENTCGSEPNKNDNDNPDEKINSEAAFQTLKSPAIRILKDARDGNSRDD